MDIPLSTGKLHHPSLGRGGGGGGASRYGSKTGGGGRLVACVPALVNPLPTPFPRPSSGARETFGDTQQHGQHAICGAALI